MTVLSRIRSERQIYKRQSNFRDYTANTRLTNTGEARFVL